jgi:hypothetical protein
MAIPFTITRTHILAACQEIDRHGVPRGRHSRGYDLQHSSRRYPPKYTIALAAKIAIGDLLDSQTFGGGVETNRFLTALGFRILKKDTPSPAPRPRSPHGNLRIAVVSLRWGSRRDEDRALTGAFAAARGDHEGPLLVLLPGVGEHWSRGTDRIITAAKKHRVHVVFQAFSSDKRCCTYTFSPDGDLNEWVDGQLFGSSADVNRDTRRIDQLLAECGPGGQRTARLVGLDIGLLVCGENNVLVNEQANKNRCAGIRHYPGRGLLEHVDLILNGAHSIMGNWGKLNERFTWLSSGGRTVVYTTNNDKKAWGSAIRVFHDGQRIADGVKVEAGSIAPFSAALLTDTQHDQFRIVVLNAPS